MAIFIRNNYKRPHAFLNGRLPDRLLEREHLYRGKVKIMGKGGRYFFQEIADGTTANKLIHVSYLLKHYGCFGNCRNSPANMRWLGEDALAGLKRTQVYQPSEITWVIRTTLAFLLHYGVYSLIHQNPSEPVRYQQTKSQGIKENLSK